ncbi:hypothetical protein M432DRAFT_649854 [Thermoascus aurantiacus ATCC 26904]
MRNSELLAGLMGSRRFRSCGTAANGFLNCLEFNSSVGEPTTVSGVQACMCSLDGQDFLDGKPGVLPRADPYYVPCFDCMDAFFTDTTYYHGQDVPAWADFCERTNLTPDVNTLNYFSGFGVGRAVVNGTAANSTTTPPTRHEGGTLPPGPAYTTVTLTSYTQLQQVTASYTAVGFTTSIGTVPAATSASTGASARGTAMSWSLLVGSIGIYVAVV